MKKVQQELNELETSVVIKSGNEPLFSFATAGSSIIAAIFAFQNEYKEHARIEFNLEEGEKLLKDLARIVNVMRADLAFSMEE